MQTLYTSYENLGISKEVFDFSNAILKNLEDRFREIDETAEFNQLKVIQAMQKNQVSEMHFEGSTGYGYTDPGRDTLEAVFADVFHTEDALVRAQIACGTHALTIALFGNLRPGDEMISVSGKPYDTLEGVIGIRETKGSLAEYGVTYKQVELLPDGAFDFEGIKNAITDKTKLIEIQRSKGYLPRPTLSVADIGEAIHFIKSIRSDIIVMVDNCYGEFVDVTEPSDFGADMIVGSLIKNPGGGLAPLGGYIAGTKECVENASYRLMTPGLGKEVGASLGVNRSFYQGLFLAPTVTASAVKGAILPMSMKNWDLKLFRTARKSVTTLSRLWNSVFRKVSSNSARASRQPLRLTAMLYRNHGPCLAMMPMLSWPPVHLSPVRPSS